MYVLRYVSSACSFTLHSGVLCFSLQLHFAFGSPCEFDGVPCSLESSFVTAGIVVACGITLDAERKANHLALTTCRKRAMVSASKT